MPPISISKEVSKNKTPYDVSDLGKDRYKQRASLTENFGSRKAPFNLATSSAFANNQSQRNPSGYFMGRSFRVGWGLGDELYLINGNGTTLYKVKCNDIVDKDEEKIKSQHLITLKAHSENITMEYPQIHSVLENNYKITLEAFPNNFLPTLPFARLNSSNGSKHLYQSTLAHLGVFSKFEHILWQLLPALYDTSLPSKFSHLTSLQTRNYLAVNQTRNLAKWLSIAAQSEIYSFQEASKHPLDLIWKYLTQRQLSKACCLAAEKGYPRLATLIAQAGQDPIFKEHLSQQLFSWIENNSFAGEDPRLIKIYILLVGAIYPTSDDCAEIPSELNGIRNKLLTTASWVQALGLGLWYGSYYDNPVCESLEDYDLATSSFPSYVKKPKPWYLNSSTEKSTNQYDTAYHLMKLNVDNQYPLKLVLDPRGYSSRDDVRCSWHIAAQLYSLLPHSSQLSSLYADTTVKLSSQLINLGLWEWSILVLLHLEDAHAREAAIIEVLGRHIELVSIEPNPSSSNEFSLITHNSSLLTDKDKFLIQHTIPESWIYRAKAYRSFYARDYRSQLQYLLLADDLVEAHRVFLYRLAPNLVFQDGFHNLRALLNQLSSLSLPGWQLPKGGRFFDDYVSIVATFDTMTTLSDVDSLSEARDKAEALLTIIHSALATSSARSTVTSHLFSVASGVSHIDALTDVHLALNEMKLTLTQCLGRISWMNLPRYHRSRDFEIISTYEVISVSGSSPLTL